MSARCLISILSLNMPLTLYTLLNTLLVLLLKPLSAISGCITTTYKVFSISRPLAISCSMTPEKAFRGSAVLCCERTQRKCMLCYTVIRELIKRILHDKQHARCFVRWLVFRFMGWYVGVRPGNGSCRKRICEGASWFLSCKNTLHH